MDWLKRLREDKPKVCEICNGELKPDTVLLLRGSHGQITVFFNNLPTLFCGQPGHGRRFIHPDFGPLLIDAVFWRKNVPLGRPGVWWAKVRCYNCNKNLSKEPSHLGEVGGTLKIRQLPPFSIRIQGPVTVCPRCGTEQLKATKEVGTEVSDVIVDAFKRAQLKP